MNKSLIGATLCAVALSCTTMNNNPLLMESPLPYGAPQFDKIRNEHYKPAFLAAIEEAKAEIDAITSNPESPTFANTIEALENAGSRLNDIAAIFYNLLEADADDEMQAIAEELSPVMTEYEMYVSLNAPLFERIKAVYDAKDGLGLDNVEMKLLEDSYKSFVRNGARLDDSQKKQYSAMVEELSLLQLEYSKNVLAATNAYVLNLTDESELEGLPDFVRSMGKSTAEEKGLEGWAFDLSAPSYTPFLKYSSRRDLREQIWKAYNSKALGGEYDNTGICRRIAELRIQIANMLGYNSHADFSTEDKMAKTSGNVTEFLDKLLQPTLPVARQEVARILEYAKTNGFGEDELQAWDWSYWSEKFKDANYSFNDEILKPYFRLEDCIEAVFGLAGKLYGLQFVERNDIPGYHKDVKVYDVKDADGRHMALFYADFFPRASKRGGAWMTSFREQSIAPDGTENRPFVSIVTNFTKPTGTEPSLLTHDELTTFLHEFGHSLHGILAEGKYASLTGTNVSRDFVELPSQIMENWAYEPEYLNSFAKHYQTGEALPAEYIDKIVETKNYLSGYLQVRQLQFGILDMAWHNISEMPTADCLSYEKDVLRASNVIVSDPGACISTAFSHIFSGGYSAGYYSYKWSEVLEADAFSLFSEKGIFNREVADSFRENILSAGSSEDEAVLYRRFRGHDPDPDALLRKLGII